MEENYLKELNQNLLKLNSNLERLVAAIERSSFKAQSLDVVGAPSVPIMPQQNNIKDLSLEIKNKIQKAKEESNRKINQLKNMSVGVSRD